MTKLLENNNLRLRAVEPEDLDTLYAWENDTELWEHGAAIVPFSRFAIKQYLIDTQQDIYRDKQLRLMIALQASGETIGTIDLYDFDPQHRRAGVGILIDKKHRHQGYGHQTLSLIERYCFDFLKMTQMYAIIPKKNRNSLKLFHKAGFTPSGTLKNWLSLENGVEDVIIVQKIHLSSKGS